MGVTAEPLHPCCRCITAPYFEDMAGLGERYARDIGTSKTYKVPSNMTYKQWKAKQDEKYGAGSVDLACKKSIIKVLIKPNIKDTKKLLGKMLLGHLKISKTSNIAMIGVLLRLILNLLNRVNLLL